MRCVIKGLHCIWGITTIFDLIRTTFEKKVISSFEKCLDPDQPASDAYLIS